MLFGPGVKKSKTKMIIIDLIPGARFKNKCNVQG